MKTFSHMKTFSQLRAVTQAQTLPPASRLGQKYQLLVTISSDFQSRMSNGEGSLAH